MHKTIKTFEDACKALNINPNDAVVNATSEALQKDIKALNAFIKLTIIARALNAGWEPNWDDSSEYKWWPWFNMRSGFGFSDSHYGRWIAGTTVGSRLCFKNEEISDYAAKQFEAIYKDLMVIE